MFGRVAPGQKRADGRGALQRAGHTVAMTGDGVNDVLALKDADVGVAMGSGSAATRTVAQLVLLDDQFADLARGDRRGAAGDGQRRAGRQPVPDQDGLRHADRPRRRASPASPYPFLPRHLTHRQRLQHRDPRVLPGPAAQRHAASGPGFVARVLRFAVPCGIVAAAAALCRRTSRCRGPTAPGRGAHHGHRGARGCGLWVLGAALSGRSPPFKAGLVVAMAGVLRRRCSPSAPSGATSRSPSRRRPGPGGRPAVALAAGGALWRSVYRVVRDPGRAGRRAVDPG